MEVVAMQYARKQYMDQLIRINELRNTDSLQPGQSLVIVYYQ